MKRRPIHSASAPRARRVQQYRVSVAGPRAAAAREATARHPGTATALVVRDRPASARVVVAGACQRTVRLLRRDDRDGQPEPLQARRQVDVEPMRHACRKGRDDDLVVSSRFQCRGDGQQRILAADQPFDAAAGGVFEQRDRELERDRRFLGVGIPVRPRNEQREPAMRPPRPAAGPPRAAVASPRCGWRRSTRAVRVPRSSLLGACPRRTPRTRARQGASPRSSGAAGRSALERLDRQPSASHGSGGAPGRRQDRLRGGLTPAETRTVPAGLARECPAGEMSTGAAVPGRLIRASISRIGLSHCVLVPVNSSVNQKRRALTVEVFRP